MPLDGCNCLISTKGAARMISACLECTHTCSFHAFVLAPYEHEGPATQCCHIIPAQTIGADKDDSRGQGRCRTQHAKHAFGLLE
jgi:hypothetical protein